MDDFEEQRIKRQQTLVDFLHTDLDLGTTFVRRALVAKELGHMDHYARSQRNATRAAEAVRRFMKQVADDRARREIGKQLADLDRLISTL